MVPMIAEPTRMCIATRANWAARAWSVVKGRASDTTRTITATIWKVATARSGEIRPRNQRRIPAATEAIPTSKTMFHSARSVSVSDPRLSGTMMDTSNRVAMPHTMRPSATPMAMEMTIPPGMLRSSMGRVWHPAGVLPAGRGGSHTSLRNSSISSTSSGIRFGSRRSGSSLSSYSASAASSSM